MATARKATAKKATKKAAAKKKATKKAAAKKATAKKAAAKKTPAKKATTAKKTATAKKTTAKKAPVRKTATAKPAAKKAITPKRALANTRKLLREKQAQARTTPPWQALDGHHGTAPQSGFQSDGARVQAEHLHEAEVRLEGNQGSVSTHDRHNQGKRDNRT